ncbi:MAG: hypothetical protein H8E44_21895 [Planctomycetes bacterium]|nr:hypothetical protein [Planctomycetota bacterium]
MQRKSPAAECHDMWVLGGDRADVQQTNRSEARGDNCDPGRREKRRTTDATRDDTEPVRPQNALDGDSRNVAGCLPDTAM